ncbi:ImmA/IrrE family metallo-endopeptidase [Celerinatantimonas sp. MCCC 1A17872]|uniref:ImmA/IrrE family metallo-endopeptidase n=1 Tax=Celerinatantimonas sp. MCCC 1A17872 TaxID=3177514 RepID=UPI0038C87A6B
MAFIKSRQKIHTPETDAFEVLETPDNVLTLAKKNGIETDPLDISKLVVLLNIKMRFEPMEDDKSGELKKDKKTGQWYMTVNSLHHPHRQRFTIAHEIAHHIKHGACNDEFIDTTFFRNSESNAMEAEANRFAAELLMPKKLFDEFVKNNSSNVKDISEHFQVSSMAVRIRAKQLGYSGHNL